MYEAEMERKSDVVIEGDIFLNKAMIHQLLKEKENHQELDQNKHYVTPSLLPRDRAIAIDVFLDNGFSATMRVAFNEALTRYNELGINLTYRSVTSRGAWDIAILLENIPNTPDGGTVLGEKYWFLF